MDGWSFSRVHSEELFQRGDQIPEVFAFFDGRLPEIIINELINLFLLPLRLDPFLFQIRFQPCIFNDFTSTAYPKLLLLPFNHLVEAEA